MLLKVFFIVTLFLLQDSLQGETILWLITYY